MFRLVRGTLFRSPALDRASRLAAWTAALVYGANPNLIYMQATAMGESLYLAFFIWAVVYFGEAVRGDGKALTKCGLCLSAACLTRYDGWFLAMAMAAVVVLRGLLGRSNAKVSGFQPARTAIVKFVLIVAFAPALWFAYNGIVYRNPLEFENGPYSAKAIEQRTQSANNPGHPGRGNLLVAGLYFLKSGQGNVAENEWLQRACVLLVIAGIAAVAFAKQVFKRTTAGPSPFQPWPLLFLLIPLPFYTLSVAYGGVPIFIPAWYPFSHYNVRYGLQLLPAFGASLALLVYLVGQSEWRSRLRLACLLGVFALVIASYTSVWQAGPTCLQEAQINMRTRNQLEGQLAVWLQRLPPDSTLLMYLGDHVGAVQRAGIPLRRVINEGNHRVWKQPADSDGLWERALADPEQYADYVVASEGDVVWQAVQGRHLRELVELHVTGQARAILYRAR